VTGHKEKENWQPGDMLVWTKEVELGYTFFFLVLSNTSYLVQKFDGSPKLRYVPADWMQKYLNEVLTRHSHEWKRM